MSSNNNSSLNNKSAFFLQLIVLLLISISCGFSSFVFLRLLDYVTSFRNSHQLVIVMLPIAGLATALLYKQYGKGLESGNKLIMETIHFCQKKTISILLAPLVLLGTLLAHLCGASVGREGTALQMAGSLTDQILQKIKVSTEERSIYLTAGVAAGFSSVFGTPWAGWAFALEVFAKRNLVRKSILPCLLASFGAHWVCIALGAQHTMYTVEKCPDFSPYSMLNCAMLGICLGLCSFLFKQSVHGIDSAFKLAKLNIYKPLVGGIILLAIIWTFDIYQYLGLGIESIQQSFYTPSNAFSFLIKCSLTAFCLGAGFKGGEVTPLFFIGATLGSSLSRILYLPLDFSAGLGFVGVFASAAHAPLTGAILAYEIFDSSVAIYAILSCIVAYLFSGSKSIYHSKILDYKHPVLGQHWMNKFRYL